MFAEQYCPCRPAYTRPDHKEIGSYTHPRRYPAISPVAQAALNIPAGSRPNRSAWPPKIRSALHVELMQRRASQKIRTFLRMLNDLFGKRFLFLVKGDQLQPNEPVRVLNRRRFLTAMYVHKSDNQLRGRRHHLHPQMLQRYILCTVFSLFLSGFLRNRGDRPWKSDLGASLASEMKRHNF